MLRRQGALAIILPNADSWSARLMQGYWTHYKLEHVAYFDVPQLAKLLVDTGFRVVSDTPALKGLTVSYLRHHLDAYPTPGFSTLFRTLDRALPDALRRRPLLMPSGERLIVAEVAA